MSRVNGIINTFSVHTIKITFTIHDNNSRKNTKEPKGGDGIAGEALKCSISLHATGKACYMSRSARVSTRLVHFLDP